MSVLARDTAGENNSAQVRFPKLEFISSKAAIAPGTEASHRLQ